jgi:hypothetical protein
MSTFNWRNDVAEAKITANKKRLRELSKSPHELVRYEVANNENTSFAVLKSLLWDAALVYSIRRNINTRRYR